MKKLEDFKENEINVKTFVGGGGWATVLVHTQQEKDLSADGSCCNIKQDYFCDSDGDGRWGSGEPGQIDGHWTWTC